MNGTHQANHQSNSSASPILVKQVARNINGIHTEVLTQSFADRILILVTQLGKVGTLTQITMSMTSIDQPYDLAPEVPSLNIPSLPIPNTSLQLTPLLSTPPSESRTIYDVFLNQIGMLVLTGFGPRPNLDPSQIFGIGRRPLIVGLALKPDNSLSSTSSDDCQGLVDLDRIRFGSVMEMIMECRVW
ncbi:uncharacterized protein MELLADRAFT_115190 [Melampsora larici-populina 98AG31]|uniref:Proteasome assembly chaperone 3 n=1 Tax=Melampsora larici-populina (strain 98AG31 / pathotype 3-4-7) TaxID=747676 RepID=F4R7I2_MELLP|nr:uncharacterized protein MELLADRAFT_115190 [Melampsora larici-populina 98AG31]EGG11784.1 hypothetical protein MELLADRAFT_115190 [Melampsora larici-populina 98AG31]